ncbi:MAG: hypothetical protein MUP98_12680 [Candidatus Aminicenantes bacterium]|nr:hypothetical protein [Candidatus Aminicenantes bacterium]
MNRRFVFIISFILAVGFFTQALAQFTPEELAEREKWEKLLQDADIVGQTQLGGKEAVTEPWVLELDADGVKFRAIWKNPLGRVKGFLESWKWEIAAYQLDKLLGLNMVPVTVEKRFEGELGSCQLWIEDTFTLKKKEEEDMKMPSYKVYPYNRSLFKQRAWDNLLYNEDRHQNQFLFTQDWRLLLIDHSRSFPTSKASTKKLIYDEKFKEGPRLMKELPRVLYENIKALTAEKIKGVVGEYLTAEEIDAVLVRRDLVIAWVDNYIKEMGEDKVLY